MAPHVKEYYRCGDRPVLLVMTLERRALQAWYPETETGKMQRHDPLIMDVLHSDSQSLSRTEFEALCTARGVDPTVPEKGIQLSFKLSALSPNQKASIVPPPANTPDMQKARNDHRRQLLI